MNDGDGVRHPRQPLVGARVVLRPPTDLDVPRILEACTDDVTVHWTRVPKPYRLEDAVWFVNAARAMELDAGEVLFVVTEVGDDQDRLTGVVGVRPDLVDLRAELGYWSHPECRGRGLMTDAVATAAAWCFEELGLHRMTAITSVQNLASQRVLVRNGFRCEATMREHLNVRGDFHDAHVYGRLRGETGTSDE